MTTEEAITTLRRFNIWRRYDGPAGCAPKMPDPKLIGQAMDVLCDYAERRIKTPKYFKLEELLRSKIALENKIENLPSWEDVENLRELAFDLDMIREDVECTTNVSSGFRCDALNNVVGGVKDSAHKTGNASDLQCPSLMFDKFCERAVNSIKKRGLRFDQLIVETNSKTKAKWLHYGKRNNAGQQRMQIKTMTK